MTAAMLGSPTCGISPGSPCPGTSAHTCDLSGGKPDPLSKVEMLRVVRRVAAVGVPRRKHGDHVAAGMRGGNVEFEC